ncbi:hypothetical protein GGTG_12136 [Gaeumannomyces tritici R3-111a-1]|uniref:Uncharacterized protein n=1 Tax=Gaeumannomyces tritici (strain R3-111a-1) TaxID=644352 RepID=J3PF57_GAET3|nr:hypothetical protein GGTG_12136 [Gaeumannomyces tritici R3-111a-1]EJT69959.1 hypothetical protein GGTG_12136 [Gaeumannomyces tritici R3-111a-1]
MFALSRGASNPGRTVLARLDVSNYLQDAIKSGLVRATTDKEKLPSLEEPYAVLAVILLVLLSGREGSVRATQDHVCAPEAASVFSHSDSGHTHI